MSIKTLYTTCTELKSLKTVADKKAFLKAHEEDYELLDLLDFMLDSRIVTGITKENLSKPVPAVRGFIAGIDHLYIYLMHNNTGNDKDIALCQGLIAMQDKEYKDFLTSIATKTLDLGVDVKIVNAVLGDDFIYMPVPKTTNKSKKAKKES